VLSTGSVANTHQSKKNFGGRATVRELLSANIKESRKRLRFTQEQLAERAAVSYQMIHDIEGCRTWVSDKTLERLAGALGVDIHELLLPRTAGAEDDDPPSRIRERLRELLKADIDRRLDEVFGPR